MSMITGGTIAVRVLQRAGVKAIFAIHGAHVDAIFQAAKEYGIRLVDMRHEAACGHAAEGYARTTRSLGVAVVTAGAGFTNIVSSMANAFIDHTPVLYIAGAPSLGEAETNTLQGGVDQVAMAAPITKWAHQINRPQDIARLVAQAIRIATTAPMGPVFLNIPIEVGLIPFEEKHPTQEHNLILNSPAYPNRLQIEAAGSLLENARRPVILAGAEAYYADAGAELRQFAETTGIPVFSDFAAHGLLPSSHPLYGGTGHKLAYVGEELPDAVLVLGSRFGLFTLGQGTSLFAADAKVIHITTDGQEIGRLRPADVAIIADANAALKMLNDNPPRMQKEQVKIWAETVQAARRRRHLELDQSAEGHNGPIHPWLAVREIAKAAANMILVADGAEAYHWLNEAVAQENPGSYLTHGHLGCMGIGLGMAIGAQTAHPESRVLLMAGDGAIGFNIAEFDSMTRQGLPIVVIVMNNHSWGASQRFQETFPGARYVTGTTLGDARYDIVASGFGAYSTRVSDIAALAPAIAAAFASGKPACIDLRIDFNAPAPEMGLMMSQQL